MLKSKKKPDVTGTKAPTGKKATPAQSRVDSLGGKPPKKKGLMQNPLFWVGIVVGTLMLIGVIIVIIAMSSNKNPETTPIIDAPTSEEIALAEAERKVEAAANIQDTQPLQSLEPLPAFATSLTPVQTLADEVLQGALVQTPQYTNGDGNNLVYPDGAVVPISHPFIPTAQARAKARIAQYIEQNGVIQERVGEDGQKAFFIRTPNNDFVELTDAETANILKASLEPQAVSYLTEELSTQRPSVAQVAPAAPVVVATMSQEERAEYRDLIEKTRSVNRDLVKENEELKKTLQDQREDMISVLQKLEDNKYTAQQLRASALGLESGWELQAIVDDRFWITDPDGNLISVAEGEVIPSTQIRAVLNDGKGRLVYVTPASP